MSSQDKYKGLIMGPIMKAATQSCNNSVANVQLIETQPLPGDFSAFKSLGIAPASSSSCLNRRDTKSNSNDLYESAAFEFNNILGKTF